MADNTDSGELPKMVSYPSGCCLAKRFYVDKPVVRLLIGKCPAAVVFSVVAIVVNSLNAMTTTRLRTHVSDKVLEFQPPTTHLNSSPAVASKSSRIGIAAPTFHGLPGVVLTCIEITMLRNDFFVKAPTRSMSATNQIPRKRDAALPAIANTCPGTFFITSASKTYDSKPTESPSLKL